MDSYFLKLARLAVRDADLYRWVHRKSPQQLSSEIKKSLCKAKRAKTPETAYIEYGDCLHRVLSAIFSDICFLFYYGFLSIMQLQRLSLTLDATMSRFQDAESNEDADAAIDIAYKMRERVVTSSSLLHYFADRDADKRTTFSRLAIETNPELKASYTRAIPRGLRAELEKISDALFPQVLSGFIQNNAEALVKDFADNEAELRATFLPHEEEFSSAGLHGFWLVKAVEIINDPYNVLVYHGAKKQIREQRYEALKASGAPKAALDDEARELLLHEIPLTLVTRSVFSEQKIGPDDVCQDMLELQEQFESLSAAVKAGRDATIERSKIENKLKAIALDTESQIEGAFHEQ